MWRKIKTPFLLVLLALIIGGKTGFQHLQAFNLILQAKELQTNEDFVKANQLLKEARPKILINILIDNIDRQLEKNEQLIADKQNYYEGIEKAEKGEWQEALTFWEKIAGPSFYSPKIKTKVEVPHEKPSGETVQLVNYVHSKDPSWDQLVAFLKNDKTDDNLYDKNSFVCTNFSQMLHNNAEKAGIKAAYVGINFVKGPAHALNAFNTSDKGLVYIDVTGKGDSYIREDFLNINGTNCEWDKVVYLNEGEKYGSISIDYLSLDPTSYQFYENYVQQWKDVGDKLDEIDIKIEEYNYKVEEHKKKIETYEKEREVYDELVKTYNEAFETNQKRINEKYQEKKDSLDKEFDDWEKAKGDYENKIKDYNNRVEKYNDDGVGDSEALAEENEELKEERDRLNQELDDLRNKADTLEQEMKNEIDQENEKLKSQKDELSGQSSSLEKQREELNNEASILDNLVAQLNNKTKDLKNQEEKLGTCYWDPLGEVVNIEIYW